MGWGWCQSRVARPAEKCDTQPMPAVLLLRIPTAEYHTSRLQKVPEASASGTGSSGSDPAAPYHPGKAGTAGK